ncbi:hypothetical protein MGL_3493 [Malassezia globosa CBS 7966]|uniref:MATE efflux family protein n=1 Tax=Malassezia globosa (strain ATCC MYA-4612 / CBS 7966) TaxID=425265 RepID=A8Q9J6_MALGO|nr:uncharacterized protein MGL_3493 [Malassezia globosa CBS 7966]EDP42244.1 hypothetical protein MGL_3493 [Malassezia globosa CBS 7966]
MPSRDAEPDDAGSVRSGNLSGIIAGDFLVASQHPASIQREDAPLLADSSSTSMIQPHISSMGNASGYGAIRPSSSLAQSISPDSHLRSELYTLLNFTIPVCATHLLELSLSVVSILSLGHLGTVELAAVSLAGITANVTGFSVISGLISALDTLLPASYTRQPHLMGLWTQRVGIIIMFILPAIVLLWLNAESGLLLLGQEPDIAHKARQFLAVLALGLPGHAVFELCRRFLQAQGVMHAPTVVLLIVSPINALANFILVWGPEQFRFGFLGAPMASAISMWLMAILCVMQCALLSHGTWGGFSRKAWDPAALKTCASLGFAGLLSLASEWWAWEIVGLVTAALGTRALASQSVLLVLSSVTYQLPYGAAVASSVRVGNLLGAMHAQSARIASHAAIVLSLLIGLLNSSIVFFTRHHLGYLFSSDDAVVELVASVLPIMALFQCADCTCGIVGGILRGCGRQSLSAFINVTAYYMAGLPVSLFLAFGPWHLGLAGLWWGLTIALVYGTITSLWYVYYMDWDKVMQQVHRTMHASVQEA